MSSIYYEHPDYTSFLEIWNSMVYPTIHNYTMNYPWILVSDDAKQTLWENYASFNSECHEYMNDSTLLLDRHKVCACYMLAIIKSEIFVVPDSQKLPEKSFYTFNENLAISVGTSLLTVFINDHIRQSHNISEDKKSELLRKTKNGIRFPPTNHGVYRENFVAELHFTKMKSNYNILSLANTLFLLEVYTLSETYPLNSQFKK